MSANKFTDEFKRDAVAQVEYLHPEEDFKRSCESKGDFFVIYNTARHSEVKGQGWRPNKDKLSAVLRKRCPDHTFAA